MRIERGHPAVMERRAVAGGWVFTHLLDNGKLSGTRFFVPSPTPFGDTGQLLSIKYKRDTPPSLAVTSDSTKNVQVVGYGTFTSTGSYDFRELEETPPMFSLLRSREGERDVIYLGPLTTSETTTNVLLLANGNYVLVTSHQMLQQYRLIQTNSLNLVTI